MCGGEKLNIRSVPTFIGERRRNGRSLKEKRVIKNPRQNPPLLILAKLEFRISDDALQLGERLGRQR